MSCSNRERKPRSRSGLTKAAKPKSRRQSREAEAAKSKPQPAKPKPRSRRKLRSCSREAKAADSKPRSEISVFAASCFERLREFAFADLTSRLRNRDFGFAISNCRMQRRGIVPELVHAHTRPHLLHRARRLNLAARSNEIVKFYESVSCAGPLPLLSLSSSSN